MGVPLDKNMRMQVACPFFQKKTIAQSTIVEKTERLKISTRYIIKVQLIKKNIV